LDRQNYSHGGLLTLRGEEKMANKLNINIGEKIRQCETCGTVFSNHLSSCPHCGGVKYNVKELTPDLEREIR